MRKSLISVLFLMFAVSTCFGQGILDKQVDCTFNKPVAEVFADLAKLAGIGISVDPTVTGQINIALGQVPLKRALEEVCRLSKSYPGLLSESSIVIASGDPKGPYYSYIVKIEVVKIRYQKVDEIKTKLSQHPLSGYITPSPAGNEVVITGPPDIIEQAKKLINLVDAKKAMIETQLAVLDDSGVLNKDRGINIERTTGPFNPNGVKTIQYNNMILGFSDTMNGIFLFQYLDNISKDNLKILAEPRVTAVEGQPATIFFGKKTFVQQFVLTGSGLSNATSVNGIESGVRFDATPIAFQELDPGTGQMVQKVLVTINAEVSEIVGTGAQGLPITNNRKITTTTIVRSGETIIVGGLKTSLTYKLRGSGGGIFRYIPLVNLLFRNSRTEERQQEISILITPTVLPRPQEKKELDNTKSVVEERKPDIVTPEKGGKAPEADESVPTNGLTDGGKPVPTVTTPANSGEAPKR